MGMERGGWTRDKYTYYTFCSNLYGSGIYVCYSLAAIVF